MVLQLPVIYIYGTGSAYKKSSDFFKGTFNSYMLGNMGYSSIACNSAPENVGFIGMQC